MTTAWEAPTNNQIPLGSSSGVAQFVFGTPVDFPSAKQFVQTWLDSSNSLLYYAVYNGTSWTAPANNQIPLGSSSGLYAFLEPTYDPASKQLVMIWQDTVNRRLYYATYDGTSWTTPLNNEIPLGSAAAVYGGGFNLPTVYSNQLVLVWLEALNGALFYATYDGTSWTAPISNQIPLGTSSGSNIFLNPSYDIDSNQLIQVWLDSNNPTLIYYSAFNGTSWSVASQVPPGASHGVLPRNLLSPIYDNAAKQTVAMWQNNSLYYASYNGVGWFAPSNNALPLGSSSSVADGGYTNPAYDSSSAQLVEVWQDAINNVLYYASYDGSNWSAPSSNNLPLGSSSGFGQYGYADPIYDDLAEQIVQIWQDSINSLYYYATYDGTNWTAPVNNQIPQGSSTTINIFRDPVYDSSSGQLLFVWQDFSNNRIYYAVYNAFPPLPPESFTGKAVHNEFLTQTDHINELAWTPANDSSVVNYLLRRNGVLIFEATAKGPFHYADHYWHKAQPIVYTLTTQDEQGLESSPLTVVLK